MTETRPELQIRLDERDLVRALRTDVAVGLTAAPKWLPPKWFYDARGSALFEEITRLPEYYPTRCERAVLAQRAPEIAALTQARMLVELGSGSSRKTRLLLDALTAHGSLEAFVPLDVSAAALGAAVAQLHADYPGLALHGLVGDLTRHLGCLPGGGGRLVAFLGGTIGNFVPAERAPLLAGLRAVLDEGEWLLLGTDLIKDPAIVVPAYDDAAGVTADFNRNVLRVVNRELAADFDPGAFDHVARWDAEREWVEMRLRARTRQRISIAALDLTVDFAAGEELHTEVSTKFHRAGLQRELAAAGFALTQWWTDPRGWFAVSLSRAVGEGEKR